MKSRVIILSCFINVAIILQAHTRVGHMDCVCMYLAFRKVEIEVF